MKYFSLLILAMFLAGCSESTKIVTANIVYIEPYNSNVQTIQSRLIFNYQQCAWIKETNSNDSLAVMFGFRISKLEDISKKFELNKPYKFRLKKVEWKSWDWLLPLERQNDPFLIFTILMPEVPLKMKNSERIETDYWQVESIRGYE
ncbi:MAG: hypothetical protein P4L45_10315 [Ignavibacteriaceae bacterium]|nr:hypothetical protein [Ignavibacteriaceae bacterium]